ncbi:MAG: hypothetical protein QW334_00415 [Thermofilum sp.]
MSMLGVLSRLRKNDLIIIEYYDNCVLDGVITLKEALKTPPNTVKTVGFYQHHDENFLYVSTEKLEEEDERSVFNIILVKYILKIRKIRVKK